MATYTNPSLNVFLNDGGGNFPSTSTKYDTRIQSNGLFLADFNEDGFLDVVMLGRGGFSDHPGTIGFVKGLGNGTFEVPVPSSNYQWIGIEDYLGHKFSPFEIIDLNGDGHKDIIGTNPTTNDKNYVLIGLGKGNGSFDLFNFIASPGDGKTANL